MNDLRAWLFCRSGNSCDAKQVLDFQEKDLRLYCDAPGLTIAGITKVSGSPKDVLPEAHRELIDNAENDRYDLLITPHMTLMGRDALDVLKTCDKLRTLGKALLFVRERIILTPEDYDTSAPFFKNKVLYRGNNVFDTYRAIQDAIPEEIRDMMNGFDEPEEADDDFDEDEAPAYNIQ